MSPPSSLSPNRAVNSDRSSSRRRKKKFHEESLNHSAIQQPMSASIKWNSDAQQQIYTSKLLHALRQVRHNNLSSPPKSGPKRVHEAADKVLAATAQGRSRWSRAILTNRLKLKFMKKNNLKKRQKSVMTAITSWNGRSASKSKLKIFHLKAKSLPSLQRKTRILSRLVPGCRKQPLPVVLEEATDYIAALEMQVRAMSALAELLSVSDTSSSSRGLAAAGGDGPNQPTSH